MHDFLNKVSQLRLPVLRHLLWLCRAPQLVRGTMVFEPLQHLPSDFAEVIYRWDTNQTLLPGRLQVPANRRLGLYVEELYHCLLEDLLGWNVLARNVPVQRGGRTIGEMDFLVRNSQTGKVEHHEVAIKFYLAYAEGESLRWYGPNPADRLDLKTQRMLNHQSQISRRSEAFPVLESLNISETVEARLFMPGYLFYPMDQFVDAPSQVAPEHERGRWSFVDQLQPVKGKNLVPVNKPHWLGPWIQQKAPDESLASSALATVQVRKQARLFARVEWNESCRLWIEQERYFIVPRNWPTGDKLQ